MNKSENIIDKELKKGNVLVGALLLLNVVLVTLPVIVVIMAVGKLIDHTIASWQIWLYGGIITLSLTLKSVFYGVSVWKVHSLAYESLVKIRINMINHLKKLPISFFQKRKTGDLANVINHDVEQVELYLAHGMPEVLSATIIPVVIFVVLLFIDWRLGLVLASSVPVTLILQKVINSWWAGWIKQYSKSTKKMSEDLIEYIASISVIKAFSTEEQRTKKVLEGMHDYSSWVKKMMFRISVPMGLISMVLEAGVIVVIIMGSSLLLNHQIDVQTFVLALVLGGIFSASFAKLATLQHYRIVYGQARNQINSVMDSPIPPKKKNSGVPMSGDIVFNNVDFSYVNDEKTLSNINLEFKQNTVNAIVGSSGSGKSTIANLIMGFWTANKGEVSINGLDVKGLNPQSLSKIVSIVQQETFMFNLSVEENIRIGKQNASKEEIIEAAKKAQIHDLIVSLPNGYDTIVGEAGAKLSGGEKQRISIARTILKNTPIILLDEATAAIDPSNEYLIQQAINSLGENKTIVMIAHHLNTITDVDQIVVMDDGKMIARGKHDDLLQTCPLYIQMSEEQNKVDNWHIK